MGWEWNWIIITLDSERFDIWTLLYIWLFVRSADMKAETQEGQRIETIQEEIEKVESDIFRKSHYTRQLEHMLLRLQKNQVSAAA